MPQTQIDLRARTLNWRHELAAERLRAAAPETFLDIGCGTGWLLRAVEGISRGTGLEADRALADRLRADGLDVRDGDAESLPFQDGAFTTVALRNVLHHMRDPAAVLLEARRVAAESLLITEPWFDPTVRSQQLAQSVDTFVKRVERHADRFHADYHDAGQILAWLDEPGAEIHIERHLRPEARTRGEWLDEIAEDLAALPQAHPLLAELAALDEQMDRSDATAEGALLIFVRLKPLRS